MICSPRSASSHWVNEEIKYFKNLNREDRILDLIVAGEPNASDGRRGRWPDQECFPEAMRFVVGADGQLSAERDEPIAGDARKNKDGKSNAKIKLIAGLIGVDFDALKQREQERRRRYLVALTTVASTVALAMAGLAIFAFGAEREAQIQAKAANTARDQADGLINFMLTDLRDKLKPIGRLKILGDVADKAKAYLEGLPSEQMTSSRLRQRAVMLTSPTPFGSAIFRSVTPTLVMSSNWKTSCQKHSWLFVRHKPLLSSWSMKMDPIRPGRMIFRGHVTRSETSC